MLTDAANRSVAATFGLWSGHTAWRCMGQNLKLGKSEVVRYLLGITSPNLASNKVAYVAVRAQDQGSVVIY